MSVLDARLIPYLLPYPLTAFAVAGLSFLFPLGPFFLSWFSSERVSFVVSTFVVHEFLWGLNGLFVLFDKIHLLSGFKIKRAKSSGAAPLDDLLVKSIKKQVCLSNGNSYIFFKIMLFGKVVLAFDCSDCQFIFPLPCVCLLW
jgi:hypothetical protein